MHIVNHTSAATGRQPLDELISIGPFKVGVRLPNDVRGKKVRSLVSDQNIASNVVKGWMRFEVRSVLDHEVLVIS